MEGLSYTGIFSKLFGAKDNTSAVKEYSFIADIAALSQIITVKVVFSSS